MRQLVMSVIVMAGGLLLQAAPAAADEFVLNESQRITCTRGLSPGKLATATCRSYAYLFNRRTSEYYRCAASVSMTRDPNEVVSVQTDGGCTERQRVFDTDSSEGYQFDAAETELANTNSFFGLGGHVVWASERTNRNLRACITLPTGVGPDVSRCIDMKFN